MKNCIIINTKQEGTVININEDASQSEIIECLNSKLISLKKLYKDDKTPILVTGKVLKSKEIEEIENLIKSIIDVEIKIDSPKKMGLSEIKRSYRKEIKESETFFYIGSLRSGQRLEYEGSIVITGDVNDGAEVIAQDNIIVIGNLRGMAHAGAKGNIGAIISASSIEPTQIRIGNLIYKEEKYMSDSVKKFAFVDRFNNIVLN